MLTALTIIGTFVAVLVADYRLARRKREGARLKAEVARLRTEAAQARNAEFDDGFWAGIAAMAGALAPAASAPGGTDTGPAERAEAHAGGAR